MVDKEKVIKGLNNIGREIVNTIGHGEAVPYLRTINDALAVLKEQEVVEPVPLLNRRYGGMTHKENVKKALEEAILFVDSRGYGGVAHIMHDALDLLKEQEAKHVNISQTHCGMTYGLCPQCEKRIDTLVNPNYCGFCGQELKWK